MTNPPRKLPSREQILEFIRSSPSSLGRRDIAKAFGVKGTEERRALRELVKELADDGLIDMGRKRKVAAPGALPDVTVLEVSGTDFDGDVLAKPVARNAIDAAGGEASEPPIIHILPDRKGPALGTGDRALCRLTRVGDRRYTAKIIKRLQHSVARVLGIFEMSEEGPRVLPTDKKARSDIAINRADTSGAEPGELVAVEILARSRLGLPTGRVVERFEGASDPRAISRIAIQENDIPSIFPDEVVKEAEKAKPVTLGKRTDLRDIPLVTIDGEDARDFDDAVFAEADENPNNKGGFRLLVAIADVAHYVRPGAPLDREALKRGNSVYFPDQVVPMLPEALSNGLCSLRPNEERACMAVEIVIGADGIKRTHRFMRGLMRSAARLTYTQVQKAADGTLSPDESGQVPDGVVAPLYAAFKALLAAREARGALDIELPEKKVILNDDGSVREIGTRQRLDAHRLIEEFMVLANVCAAETLEEKRQPCMYRVHDTPAPDKVDALREVLSSLEIAFAKGQVVRPKLFNAVLQQAKGRVEERMINELVLRTQSQAVYSPDNLGHFGLALSRYAHFTSPIRRYSDLLVHRALIRGCGLGSGGLRDEDGAQFHDWGEQISITERRASAAERVTIDRYLARYLSNRVGAEFEGRLSGVTRFGLFVTLEESGADGLIPIRTLPDDYYDHDAQRHCLVGRSLGHVYTLGDMVQVKLLGADPVSGSVALELISGGSKLGKDERRRARGQRKHGPGPKSGRRGRSAKKPNARSGRGR